jgi:hypothetical protein
MKEMMGLKETRRKNKVAAMEMTVGTIVTIVLLMSALVLGLILTQTIFKGSKENIESIDEGVKNQINEMFAKDDLKKIVLYPGRSITLKKGGDEAGFGFSIRNLDTTKGTFSYNISSIENNCGMDKYTADKLISLGKIGSGMEVLPGDVMSNPVLVTFAVPDSTPPCNVRYQLTIKKTTPPATLAIQYEFIQVDVKIVSK